MRGRFIEWITFALCLTTLLELSATCVGSPPATAEFVAAKQLFIKGMNNRNPVNRVEAVAKLAEFADTGSAEQLLKRGVTDSEEKVRLAARTSLKKLAADKLVCTYLLDELKKSSRRQGPTGLALEMVRAIASVVDPARRLQIVKAIDESLCSPKSNLLIPITLIDEFGEQGDVDAVRAVELLAEAKVFQDHFGYRRCCIQAMLKIRQREAIDYLIGYLAKSDGLIQYDIVTYLTRVTKQSFRGDVEGWQKWWEENRDEFEFAEEGKEPADSEEDYEGLSYYRIPICAKRIVFVLDTSGSMSGRPIELAKEALIKVILALPEEVQFNVVMFHGVADAWQPRLVDASPKMKRHAVGTIHNRQLGGMTASSAALRLAFRQEPEAIYFVSDGEPTDAPPAQIIDHFTQLNKLYRVSIHTVGVITTNHGGIGLSRFLEPLSDQNYGKFRLID